MQDFIKTLEIRNYKSIRHAKLDCRKINILVGRPNVGKSNLIEALSLLAKPTEKAFFGDYIVYNEDISNLFRDRNINEPISVVSDVKTAIFRYFQKNNVFAFLAGDNFDDEQMENLKNIDEYKQFEGKYNELKNKNDTPGNVYFSQIQKNGAHSLDPIEQTVKRYIFRRDAQRDNPELGNLISPFGENFFKVLITSRYLKENLKEYFGDYQLEIVYNSINNDLYIQKNLEGIVYPLPFVLVADTLQRILFYKAAIDSNSGSVLLFEEPEVNSFPPYVIDLANAIAMDEKNQFFISTHSPYLVINLLESAYDKAALFVMDYADHETNVIRIPPDQISKVLEHGYDFFLNMEEFTHE